MLDDSLVLTGVSSAAEEVATLAAELAAHTESERRLRPDLVQALVAAGFARHFVPAS